jgi:hypothetical protein
MSGYALTDENAPGLNTGTDREIDDQPPGKDCLGLIPGTGDAYPGRRNATARPTLEEVASALADHDRFQSYGGWSPTNAVDADPYLYNTSDRQPVMPMEVTGALWDYLVKGAEDLNYSGLFDTDHIDPRMPESLQNLLDQALRTGTGVTGDQAVAKAFDDLRVMDNGTSTMNTQGDGTAGAPLSGKEAAMRARLDARRRYNAWL